MLNRIFILIIVQSIFSYASLLDFRYISNYLDSYNSKNYQESLKYLKLLNKDNAVINYNMANIYYKMNSFKKAIKYYKRAVGKGVDEANRVYGIANSYFKLKEYDHAIYAYKIALEHRDIKDARYNIFLAKKMKFREKIKKEKKKIDKKSKKKDGQSKNKDKNKLKKKKKLTKEEIKKLNELKRKMKFKDELKKKLKNTFKSRKIPVLLYKIETKEKPKEDMRPW